MEKLRTTLLFSGHWQCKVYNKQLELIGELFPAKFGPS